MRTTQTDIHDKSYSRSLAILQKDLKTGVKVLHILNPTFARL
jgi:hypothetical protein